MGCSTYREEFNEDLCKLFVSCGFAWNGASNPEMHLFCEKWIPGSEVPDHRLLSGQVLNQEVERVEAKTKDQAEGKIATGMSDRWKNISKTPVNTTLMVVDVRYDFLNNQIIQELMLSHL